MSTKGGLPAIPAYDIERHHYLHELTWQRAFKRVHGLERKAGEVKRLQREMCRARREHYGN